MAEILLGSLVLIMVVVGAVVLVVRLTDPSVSAHLDPAVVTACRRARGRALTCVAVAGVAVVAGLTLNALRPELLGLPLALSPGVAAAVGLIAYAVLPDRREATSGPTTASLAPRHAWSFGSRRAFGAPAGIAAAFLAFLAWATWVAGPDEQGRMRQIAFTADTAAGTVSTASGPFPGSFYGVPLASVTVVLAGATYLALRRIATIPAAPLPLIDDPVRTGADRHWRAVSTRVVTRLATAALLGYAGGTATFAGLTLRSAAASLVANGGPDHGTRAGVALAIVGFLLVLAGVGAAIGVVVRAASLRPPSTGVLRPAAAAAPPA